MPNKHAITICVTCKYKPYRPGRSEEVRWDTNTIADSNWEKVTRWTLENVERKLNFIKNHDKTASASIALKFNGDDGKCKSIPIKKLKDFFDSLPSSIDTIIFNPIYIENYSIEELIQLGKSLKYIRNIQQTEKTVINPKLDCLIAHTGSEFDKKEIEEVLRQYLPPDGIVKQVVAPFIFSEKENDFAATKKKAKDNCVIRQKEHSFFKLQCLCAFALISLSALLVGILAMSATCAIPLIIAGSIGIAVAAGCGLFNRKEIAEVLSVDKPTLNPS